MKPDPDNDRVYTRPRAWRNMKEAFANGDPVRRALVRLEKCGRGCPREPLTAVIRHYLSLPDDEQIRIALDYLHGPYAPRTVKLAGEEYVVRVTREDRLFYRPEGEPAEELTYLVDTVALELVIAGGVDPAEYQVIIEAAAVLAAEKAAERRRAA